MSMVFGKAIGQANHCLHSNGQGGDVALAAVCANKFIVSIIRILNNNVAGALIGRLTHYSHHPQVQAGGVISPSTAASGGLSVTSSHQIKVGDVYQDENGRPVRILCTDKKAYKHPVVGLISTAEWEILEVYTDQGISASTVHGNLTLPESYDDWEIDDPIWVWDDGDAPAPRHFAGVTDDGRVLAWQCGATSVSNEQEPIAWAYASKTDMVAGTASRGVD